MLAGCAERKEILVFLYIYQYWSSHFWYHGNLMLQDHFQDVQHRLSEYSY